MSIASVNSAVRRGGIIHRTLQQTGAGIKLGALAVGQGLKGAVISAPVGAAKSAKDIVTLHPIRAANDLTRAVEKTLEAPLSVGGGAFQMVESAASLPVKALKNGALGKPGVFVGKAAGGLYDMFVGGMMKDLAEGDGKQKLSGIGQAMMFMMPIGGGAKLVDGTVALAKSAVQGGEGAGAGAKLLQDFARGRQSFGFAKVKEGILKGGAITASELTAKREAILAGEKSVDAALAEHLTAKGVPAELHPEQIEALKAAQPASGMFANVTKRFASDASTKVVTETEAQQRMRIAKLVTEDDRLTRPQALFAGGKIAAGEFVRQSIPQTASTRFQKAGDQEARAENAAVEASGKTPLAYTAIQTPSVDKAAKKAATTAADASSTAAATVGLADLAPSPASGGLAAPAA